MKTTSMIMSATALVFALSGAAVAADKPSPQNIPGTAVEGNAMENNVGALTAPEANKTAMAPSTGSSESGNAAANIPGTDAEGNSSEDKAHAVWRQLSASRAGKR
jgi:hypothetical protein